MLVPAAAHPLIPTAESAMAIDYLEQPDARLGADPRRARAELFRTTLAAAAAELAARLGPDPAAWQWGRLHQAEFTHALAGAFPAAAAARQLNLGPVAKAGDNESLGRSTWRTSDFRLTAGASARFVADVGDWDRSVATNSPGQSGDPRSPHYRDLFGDWAADRYFPLTYTRAAVEQVAATRILLTPAR